MDRRNFLLTTGAALTSLSVSPVCLAASHPLPPAVAPGRRLTLSVANRFSADPTVVQANLLARIIQATSATPLHVQVVDAAAVPNADLGLVTASALVDRDAGFAFVTGLPGNQALNAASLDEWLIRGGGQPLLDQLAATHGLKVLAAAHSGDSFLWSRSPFESAADFAGKAVQADGLARHVAAGLGAEPWRILDGEPAASFAQGSLAAVECGIEGLVSAQLHTHTRYAIGGALAPHGTTAALTVKLETWQAFSPAEQALISAAARTNYLESVALNRTMAMLNGRSLAQSFNIALAPSADALSTAIQTVSRAMVASAAASSTAAKNLNASYMSFLMNPLNSNGENCYV